MPDEHQITTSRPESGFADSLLDRALQLAPLYRAGVRHADAVKRTGIPKSTVARLFRVFKAIEEGKPDSAIAGKEYRVETVATLRLAYMSSAAGPRLKWSINQFLIDHGARINMIASELRRSLPSNLPSWPSNWLEQNWPEPFEGRVTDDPLLNHESDLLFDGMVSHLNDLQISDHIRSIKRVAIMLRNSVMAMDRSLLPTGGNKLTGGLRSAAILYGAQMAESPGQDPTVPEVDEASAGKWFLRLGGTLVCFDNSQDAESAGSGALALIEAVRSSPHIPGFLDLRKTGNQVLEGLRLSLENSEDVRLLIDTNRCHSCGPVKDLLSLTHTSGVDTNGTDPVI